MTSNQVTSFVNYNGTYNVIVSMNMTHVLRIRYIYTATMWCLKTLQRTRNHSRLTHQKTTKLPVLFHVYLLQVMHMTFQYQTVSCIPAIGNVPNISGYDTGHGS